MVEGLSLDEAFLDVSASLNLFGSATDIARAIKQRIQAVTGLSASVGVAGNKLVAKIASDLDKPDGLVVVSREQLRATLDPLLVQVIPGIGKETLRRLHRADIRTMGDLRLAPDSVLESIFGRFAQRTRERASGIDTRAVVAERAEKSISAEETFETDLQERAALCAKLLQLAERTTSRLRAKSLTAGTVQLKIRQADFTTFTRQRSLNPPSSGTDTIYHTARELLDTWLAEHPGTGVRLLGIGGSKLTGPAQPDMFSSTSQTDGHSLDQLVDQIRDKFGTTSVGRARSLDADQIG
jgi:DNA polymerase-4